MHANRQLIVKELVKEAHFDRKIKNASNWNMVCSCFDVEQQKEYRVWLQLLQQANYDGRRELRLRLCHWHKSLIITVSWQKIFCPKEARQSWPNVNVRLEFMGESQTVNRMY